MLMYYYPYDSDPFCDAAQKVRDVQHVSLSLWCDIVVVRFRPRGGLIRRSDVWQWSSTAAAAILTVDLSCDSTMAVVRKDFRDCSYIRHCHECILHDPTRPNPTLNVTEQWTIQFETYPTQSVALFSAYSIFSMQLNAVKVESRYM